MRIRGIATVVALAGTLIAGAAAPAAAADGPVIISTGFTAGQRVPLVMWPQPVLSDDVTQVEYVMNGKLSDTYDWPDDRVRLFFDAKDHETDIDLTLRAWDAAGRVARATVRVRVDAQRPVPQTYTPGPSSWVHGPTTITVTPDADDYAEVALYRTGGAQLAKVTQAPWVLQHDFTGEDGLVYLVAKDTAGNVSGQFEPRYRVDDAGPVVDVRSRFVKPGRSSLSSVVEEVSGLSRIEWWIDGALRSTERDVTYDFGTRIRTVPVEVRAWDVAGNSSVTTIPVQLDNTAPVVSKATPDFQQLVRGKSVTSTITATDAAGFASVQLDRGDPLTTNVPGPTRTFTASRPLAGDGYLTLNWTVVDGAGNVTKFPRTILVDNTLPKITKITAPATNTKVGGQVKTSVTATDQNGIREVQIWVNGELTLSDSKAPYDLTLNTTKYSRGLTVAFYAVDKAGNTISSSIRTWKR